LKADVEDLQDGEILRLWSARTRPRFGTGRHVARKKGGVMPPHSKIMVMQTRLKSLYKVGDGQLNPFGS